LKTRLLGAAVLIALLVIFVPMFFSSNPSPATSGGDQSVSLAIPPAQDNNLQTRTLSLTPGAPAASASTATPAPVAGATAAAPAQPASGQLASVSIPSNRPPGPGSAVVAPTTQPNTPAMGSGASPSQPVIPLRGGAANTPAPAPAVAKAPVKTVETPVPAAAPAVPPAAVASTAAGDHVLYVLNLSAYANTGSVDRLVRRVRGFGYPVLTRIITQAGKQLTLVTAGPFDSRTSAEAARLKITQAIPGVPAKLEAGLGHADASLAPAPTAHAAALTAVASAPRAGGYAVQVAAMGSQAEANALRDKLRANGFDGFVDTVAVNGKRLWRVRAGPQTQRADAERVRDQIKAKLGLAGNVVGVP
jgi:cell division septation protein DedD